MAGLLTRWHRLVTLVLNSEFAALRAIPSNISPQCGLEIVFGQSGGLVLIMFAGGGWGILPDKVSFWGWVSQCAFLELSR